VYSLLSQWLEGTPFTIPLVFSTAGIVLGPVVAGQDVQTPGSALVRMGLMATVLFSILANGYSASPGIRLYAQQAARLGADAPESEAVPKVAKP